MIDQFELKRHARAGAAVGLALAIEHALCYREDQFQREGELVLFGSNVLGVLTIAIGAGWAKRSALVTARIIVIAAVAALTVAGLRVFRRNQRLDRLVQWLAGHAAGLVDGTRRYEQAYRTARGGPGF